MRKGTKNQHIAKKKRKIPNKRPVKKPGPVIKAVKGGQRVRNCCWTLWDPTKDELDQFEDWTDDKFKPKEIQFCCAQLECADDERQHLQGYVEFTKQMVLSGIKRVFFGIERLHVEKRRGSQKQAIVYCTKQDTRVLGPDAWSFQVGECKRQGVHEDNIRNAVKAVDQQMDLEEIEDNFPVQMTLHKNKLIDRYIEKKGKRFLKPSKKNVLIFCGPSGTGKSTTAWKNWPSAYKGVWPTGGRWWWPNYRGQKTVIFDEFRENLNYQQMLGLLDIWPMSIEYKGGNTENVSKRIVITTVRDPTEWYKGVEDKSELQRRINENCTIYDFETGRKAPDWKFKARKGNFAFDPYVPQDANYN